MANIKEAYTAVIEFNKTIVSITSAILAAIISFLVFQDFEFNLNNAAAPGLLVLSLIFSFLGIGHAIPAINVGQSKIWAVRFSNLGAGVMIAGILAIWLIKKPEKATIEKALSTIEKSFATVRPTISSSNCERIEFEKDAYVFYFKKDSTEFKIVYSISKDEVISYKREKY